MFNTQCVCLFFSSFLCWATLPLIFLPSSLVLFDALVHCVVNTWWATSLSSCVNDQLLDLRFKSFFLVVLFRNARNNSFNHCAPPLCISFVLVFIYFLLVTIVVSFSFATLNGIFSFPPSPSPILFFCASLWCACGAQLLILVISSWKLFVLCFCQFFYNTCKRAFDNCVLLLCIAFVLVFMVFFCFALWGGIFSLVPLGFFFFFLV